MYIRELSVPEFEKFCENHPYNNYHQSINYARFKSDQGYEYEMIGYFDNDKIIAAGLVLVKPVNNYLYAYVPEGFLIDYKDNLLIENFSKALYDYYKKEDITFIKINPPIPLYEINPKDYSKKAFDNHTIINLLENNGYKKLKNNIYFESLLPRTNAIVNLESYKFGNLKKNARNKIRKAERRGLCFEKGDSTQLNILHNFIKNKIKKGTYYFNDYFNIFSTTKSIDYFLISIDYDKAINNLQLAYQDELRNNKKIADNIIIHPNNKNVNRKVNSDSTLTSYKNDITLALDKLKTTNKEYIAAALVVKHGVTATILIHGYDRNYKEFAPNYYLYYQIIEHYKNDYKFINLNGLTCDFTKNNKYYGLNQFKLSFNPKVYEYIGEFDFVINPRIYKKLINKGYLDKEFQKD